MNRTSKRSAAKRATHVVPAVSLEEVEVLSPEERTRLLSELKAAEARIEKGQFVAYDREDQKRRFAKINDKRS